MSYMQKDTVLFAWAICLYWIEKGGNEAKGLGWNLTQDTVAHSLQQ